MKKRKKNRSHHEEPIPWLPIDSRIIPLLSFPHVQGAARVFLTVEMCIACVVVVGTLLIVLLSLFF